MKLTLLIIFFIVYGLFQLITHILQQRAKQEEERRRREAMERRRQEALGYPMPPQAPGQQVQGGLAPGEMGQQSPARGGTTMTQPFPVATRQMPAPQPFPVATPVRTGTPADDLAARRKEQLEQLRARRETRRVGQPVSPGAGGGAGAGARGARSGPPRDAAPSIGRSSASPQRTFDAMTEDARRRMDEAQRRQREQAQALREAKAHEAERDQAALRRRQEQARLVTEQTAAALALQRSGAEPSAAGARRFIPILRSTLHDRGKLRELFVLKELLDPPVSVREPEQAG